MKKNLSCIIIDDDPVSRKILEKLCSINQINILAQFQGALEALSFLQNQKTDILFLDIDMPEFSGFNLLDKLESTPNVVITSGNPEYALTAFDYTVTDFLKKPITPERFKRAVEKVKENITLRPDDRDKDNLVLKSDGNFIKIKLQEILFIESVRDYVKYVTTDKKHIVHGTLKSVEDNLKDQNFRRIHRSYIVNTLYIKSFDGNSLKLFHDYQIPVSKAHKSSVISILNSLRKS